MLKITFIAAALLFSLPASAERIILSQSSYSPTVNAEQERRFNKVKRLADNGQAEAQYQLGIHYLMGKGVSADKNTASYWFGEAAKQDHSAAALALKVTN